MTCHPHKVSSAFVASLQLAEVLLVGANMANCVAFQSKLTSIMDVLAKAAVLEISKLWEDGVTLVQVELRRKENEIEVLNRKLMLMESERMSGLSQKQPSDQLPSSSRRGQQSKLLPLAADGKRVHTS